MHRFFAYEEYGAKYEMMVKDVASARGTIPQWDEYQKGLEALAASVSSANLNRDQPHRALVVGDLLVKVKPLRTSLQDTLTSSSLSNECVATHFSSPNSSSRHQFAIVPNLILKLRRS